MEWARWKYLRCFSSLSTWSWREAVTSVSGLWGDKTYKQKHGYFVKEKEQTFRFLIWSVCVYALVGYWNWYSEVYVWVCWSCTDSPLKITPHDALPWGKGFWVMLDGPPLEYWPWWNNLLCVCFVRKPFLASFTQTNLLTSQCISRLLHWLSLLLPLQLSPHSNIRFSLTPLPSALPIPLPTPPLPQGEYTSRSSEQT